MGAVRRMEEERNGLPGSWGGGLLKERIVFLSAPQDHKDGADEVSC